MIMIIDLMFKFLVIPVNRRVITIALHVTRIMQSYCATLLYLCQCIHLWTVRILMSELRCRLLQDQFVDVLILFAIFSRRWSSSVTSVWPLIPVATRPVAVVCTTHHRLPLLYSHYAIDVPRLLIPVGLQGLLTQLVFEDHLRLGVFDCLRNIYIRLSHL